MFRAKVIFSEPTLFPTQSYFQTNSRIIYLEVAFGRIEKYCNIFQIIRVLYVDLSIGAGCLPAPGSITGICLKIGVSENTLPDIAHT
jgi:hypothetical protein